MHAEAVEDDERDYQDLKFLGELFAINNGNICCFLKKHSYSKNEYLIEGIFVTIARMTADRDKRLRGDDSDWLRLNVIETFECDYYIERLARTFTFWVETKKNMKIALAGLESFANLLTSDHNLQRIFTLEDDGWFDGYEPEVMRSTLIAIKTWGAESVSVAMASFNISAVLCTHYDGKRELSKPENLTVLVSIFEIHSRGRYAYGLGKGFVKFLHRISHRISDKDKAFFESLGVESLVRSRILEHEVWGRMIFEEDAPMDEMILLATALLCRLGSPLPSASSNHEQYLPASANVTSGIINKKKKKKTK